MSKQDLYEQQLQDAFALYRQRDYQGALQAYEAMRVTVEDQDHRLHHGIGDCLMALHRPEEAVPAFREALNRNPRYFRSYLNLGIALFDLRRYELALLYLQQARALNATEARIPEVLGLTTYRLGRYEEAAGHFSDAIALNPDSINLHCHLHKQWVQLGRRDEALAMLHRLCRQLGWPEALSKAYEFSAEPWFLKNVSTFQRHGPQRRGQAGLHCLEIGSFEGMSACWLLDKFLTGAEDRLICIDPQFQAPLRANIERSGAADRVRLIEQTSQDALFELEDASLDWAYIDGWHIAPQVLLDGLMVWPLMKAGATMVFDDYQKEDQSGRGQTVRLGADAFVAMMGDHAEVLESGRQLIVRKRTAGQPDTLAAHLTALAGLLEPAGTVRFAGEGRSLIESFKDWLLARFDLPWQHQSTMALLQGWRAVPPRA